MFMVYRSVGSALPSISGVADTRVIIKEHSNGFIRQLESEAVFVGVVNPLGDEQRALLA